MPIASMTKTAPDSALSPWEVRQKEEALALQEKTDAPEIVAAQKKASWLSAPQNEKRIKPDQLTPLEASILKNFSATQRPGGGLTLFDEAGKSMARMYSDGSVAVNPAIAQPPGNPEHIDALLKGAIAFKSVNGPECEVWDRTGGLEAMIEAKAYSLAGLKVDNAPSKTLDEVNPELARRMEEAWARIQNGNRLQATAENTAQAPARTAERFESRPTQSVASQVEGLVSTRSALDNNTIALNDIFRTATIGPVSAPAATPASPALPVEDFTARAKVQGYNA